EQDGLFDRLFRKHLQNVYQILGDQPPPELAKPISLGHRHPRLHSEPTGLLNVKVDGRQTYFEWINAGRYVNQGARGTMAMASERLVSDLYFGFDRQHLLVRLDARDGPVREKLGEIDALRIVFLQPQGFELSVTEPASRHPVAQLCHNDLPVAKPDVEVAADLLFELSVPFRSLALAAEESIHFCVELLQDGQPVERIPHEGAIEATVPSEEYELIMWQA
ncbi:MAG: alpha-amylase/alpha-mannosidase, partial [Candidatus Nealsonbacteria bacterium]|nr:alpha-amylase/alpha-mannosidase [Candidatus Nealsonbacteria bacterium]